MSKYQPIEFKFGDGNNEQRYSDQMLLSNAIAEQMWREQQLVTTRMRWNFAVQGFLCAVVIYVETALAGTTRLTIQWVLVFAGSTINIFILKAIEAAQSQSTRLRTHWVNQFTVIVVDEDETETKSDPLDCDITDGGFVQPFSPSSGSKKGRFATYYICLLLIAFWIFVFIVTGLQFYRGP